MKEFILGAALAAILVLTAVTKDFFPFITPLEPASWVVTVEGCTGLPVGGIVTYNDGTSAFIPAHEEVPDIIYEQLQKLEREQRHVVVSPCINTGATNNGIIATNSGRHDVSGTA